MTDAIITGRNRAADTNRAILARRESQPLLDAAVAEWPNVRIVFDPLTGYRAERNGVYRVLQTHEKIGRGQFTNAGDVIDGDTFLDICTGTVDPPLASWRDEDIIQAALTFAVENHVKGNDLHTLTVSLRLVLAAQRGAASFDVLHAGAYLHVPPRT